MEKAITGKWMNQLGSTMELVATNDGIINGNYFTKVGDAISWHRLIGQWCSTEEKGALISFTVCWTNKKPECKHSCTAWNGILYIKDNDELPFIYATWTLASDVPFCDEWKSTLISKDTFKKCT